MSNGFEGLLFGAIGGGIVAFIFRQLEKIIEGRRAESTDAKKKLLKYSQPLWLACNDLHFRLADISKKINKNLDDKLRPLTWPLSDKIFDYVSGLYYATSTAYVFANVSACIRLFQKDVVFLQFKEESITDNFFDLINNLKKDLTTDSILWFHYFNGIGDYLIQNEVPLSIAEFSIKLAKDKDFRDYYTWLFYFVKDLAETKDIQKKEFNQKFISKAIDDLRRIKQFLKKHGAVPSVSFEP
jgi:hypothetical protein